MGFGFGFFLSRVVDQVFCSAVKYVLCKCAGKYMHWHNSVWKRKCFGLRFSPVIGLRRSIWICFVNKHM